VRGECNRARLGLPKCHAYDALCVGASTPDELAGLGQPVFAMRACGRGSYQRSLVDAYGFPQGKPRPRQKRHFGFQTGDLVRAQVPKGKYAGNWTGRVAVRSRPCFALRAHGQSLDGIHPKYLRLLQRGDGYAYELASPPEMARSAGL